MNRGFSGKTNSKPVYTSVCNTHVSGGIPIKDRYYGKPIYQYEQYANIKVYHNWYYKINKFDKFEMLYLTLWMFSEI